MAVTDESCKRGIFRAQVLANQRICPDHYLLRLAAAGFPPSRPGQFVNIQCGPADQLPGAAAGEWPRGRWPKLTQPELIGRRPLLRRPFSLAGRADSPEGKVQLDIIHRVVGAGTTWLAKLSAGEQVNLLGPLGNGFSILGDRPTAALVGGGVGIPPLLYLAEALAQAGRKAVAFAGARTARRLPLNLDGAESPSRSGRPTMCCREFAQRGAATVVATDDGSAGVAGPVHEALLGWMDRERPAPAELAVYACGPEAMMKAVADICLARGYDCQVALERHMACGVGTCQGCVVKVKADSPAGWQFKLACKDGPVFNADQIIW